MRIGFVVNPIAGMGGRVGLKGTDGKVDEARARGAEPRAPERARAAMGSLHEHAPETRVLTWGAPMGEEAARAAGFDPEVVGRPEGEETTAADTRAAVRAVRERGVDLLVFVGGDGTAADVAEELDGLPMLGVPAGVKVYSSVFAVDPRAAGRIVATYDRVEGREVTDIDEDAYRGGEVVTDLVAVVDVPVAEEVQSSKQLAGGTVETLAAGVAAEARASPGTTYVLGPGSTVGAIKRELGFGGSPLGVDVWRDGEVSVRDGAAADVEAALGEHNVVVVSPIGGQGFVLGRGNQQLSPEVVRRSDLEVVASGAKLDDLDCLRVDTGDPDLDEALRGWAKVRVGRFERRMMRIV